MAATQPTDPTRAARHAEVRRLADEEQLSNRAIARRLQMHHTTVGRILSATPAPDAPAERTTTAPPERTAPVTSDDDHTTPPDSLLHPRLFADISTLMDPRTGDLPAPLARVLHRAAEAQRTAWRTAARTRRTD